MSVVRSATFALTQSLDVMAMIFEEVIRECEAYTSIHQEVGWNRLLNTLRTLSQISPMWREMVILSPRLWTTVRYYPNRIGPYDRIGFLSAHEYIRRSRVLPLDVWIADCPRGNHTLLFGTAIADAIAFITRHRTEPVILRAIHIALVFRTWPNFNMAPPIIDHCARVKHLTLTYAHLDYDTITTSFAKFLSIHQGLRTLQLVGCNIPKVGMRPITYVDLPALEYVGIESSLEGAGHILRMIRSNSLCTVSLKATSRSTATSRPLFEPIPSITYLSLSGDVSVESLEQVLVVAPNALKLKIHHIESQGIYTERGRSSILYSIRDRVLLPDVRLVELEAHCHFTFAFIFPAFAERFLGPYMTVADAFDLKTDDTMFSYDWGLFRLDLSRFFDDLDEGAKRKWAAFSKHVTRTW